MPKAHKKYYAAGVIVRRKRGVLEFLVMDTEQMSGKEKGQKETKFPGGMEEPQDDGNPKKTLRREIWEETGLRIKNDAAIRVISDVEGRDGHRKYFYFVRMSACRGVLRTITITDGGTILHPPRWVERAVLQSLHSKHLIVLHSLPV